MGLKRNWGDVEAAGWSVGAPFGLFLVSKGTAERGPQAVSKSLGPLDQVEQRTWNMLLGGRIINLMSLSCCWESQVHVAEAKQDRLEWTDARGSRGEGRSREDRVGNNCMPILTSPRERMDGSRYEVWFRFDWVQDRRRAVALGRLHG